MHSMKGDVGHHPWQGRVFHVLDEQRCIELALTGLVVLTIILIARAIAGC